MSGPRLRLALRIAAWAVILIGPITALMMIGDTLAGTNTVLPEDGKWRFVLSMIYGAALPLVQGGVLLALVSIDERIQMRDA